MPNISFPTFANAMEINRALERIVRAISRAEERVDFLVGAGMSIPSGLPSGATLSRLLLRELFPDSAREKVSDAKIEELQNCAPLEAIADAVQLASGRTRDDLTKLLKSLYLTNAAPDQAHRDLVTLSMWEGVPRLERIFTTNFDHLLEHAFDQRGVEIAFHNTERMIGTIRDGKVPIIHVHGTLDSGQYQITEGDVFDTRFRLTDNILRGAFSEADAFVFVGYSMTDPDFRRLYRSFRQDLEDRRKTQGAADRMTYAVMPVSDPESYELARLVWQARGAILIPLSAGDFFARIKEILSDQLRGEVEAALTTKFGIDKQELAAKVAAVAAILRVEPPEAEQFLLEARTKVGE